MRLLEESIQWGKERVLTGTNHIRSTEMQAAANTGTVRASNVLPFEWKGMFVYLDDRSIRGLNDDHRVPPIQAEATRPLRFSKEYHLSFPKDRMSFPNRWYHDTAMYSLLARYWAGASSPRIMIESLMLPWGRRCDMLFAPQERGFHGCTEEREDPSHRIVDGFEFGARLDVAFGTRQIDKGTWYRRDEEA